jgi:hypothetical protein
VQRRARADASVRTVTVCCHRAAARFGFFLEFDRGTERPAEHAAKLASYYRYRDSAADTRDYASFPGPFRGVPPTGKPITFEAFDVVRFDEVGKIAERWGSLTGWPYLGRWA